MTRAPADQNSPAILATLPSRIAAERFSDRQDGRQLHKIYQDALQNLDIVGTPAAHNTILTS